jgi:hypothetical protein
MVFETSGYLEGSRVRVLLLDCTDAVRRLLSLQFLGIANTIRTDRELSPFQRGM